MKYIQKRAQGKTNKKKLIFKTYTNLHPGLTTRFNTQKKKNNLTPYSTRKFNYVPTYCHRNSTSEI